MELSPKQQIAELIKSNQRILVVGHQNHGGDLLGSMLALERVLAKNDKEVTLVLTETIDPTLLFLPGIEKIQKDITGQRDLIIQINKQKHPIDKISYNEEDDFINIVVSPKGQGLDAKNLNFLPGNFKFDLIFVLDTPDVEKIDTVYDKYTELFFETPIVNIDHHTGNEYFGTVNLVDMTATSTAEVLVSIIEAMGPGNFDADVATCLLTGITADTASFKNTNTTPKSLTISAQMLAAGARQQEIIQNLYKTRPLSTLKVWGRVLSALEYDSEHRMVWSSVTKAEMEQSDASVEGIQGVLDELLANAPGTDVVLVLVEENGGLVGKLKGLNGQDVLSIAEAFGGSGHALAASFQIPKATLATQKDSIIAKIMQLRDEQLGRENVAAATPKTEDVIVEVELEANSEADLAELRAEELELEQSVETAEIEAATGDEVIVDVELEANSIDDLGNLLSMEKAVEGLESDEVAIDPTLSIEEIFGETSPSDVEEEVTSEEVAEVTSNDDSIEKALESIDNEIETPVETEETPNIDIEDVKDKKEALRQISEVMHGYQPGKALDEKGNQPIDRNLWK